MILDFSNSKRENTNIQGYLAILDSDGGNQREIIRFNEINVSCRKTAMLSLKKDETQIIKIHNVPLFFVLAALVAGVCDAGIKKEIRFAAGSTSATIEESVIRGDRDLYHLGAKAGQTMEVSICAIEENAVFAIFKPGTTATVNDGITEIKGEAIPKASETMRQPLGKEPCRLLANT